MKKVYILQHTLTNEVLAVFENEELANKWQIHINYSRVIEFNISID